MFNTARGRHQDRNIHNDTRVGIPITDPDNTYRYLEIRGRAVEMSGSAAEEHLDRMARKYLGTRTYVYKQRGEVRVMYKIKAERVIGYSYPHAEHLSPRLIRILHSRTRPGQRFRSMSLRHHTQHVSYCPGGRCDDGRGGEQELADHIKSSQICPGRQAILRGGYGDGT